MGTPSWWTEADTEAVERYREWESTDWYPGCPEGMDPEEWVESPAVCAGLDLMDEFVDDHEGKWSCRRCRYWTSADGLSGDCSGPELALGYTEAESRCEQWQPLELAR